MKARFRWVYSDWCGAVGGYWLPMNYEAETMHLMRVYGHTNINRRFKKE